MGAYRTKTEFPVSLYASGAEGIEEVFYTVPRAGHMIAGSEHRILRDHFPGHELIYCLSGRGWVRVMGQTYSVAPGDFVWINCHHPHAHGAVREDPWEVYWIRVEGPRLEQFAGMVGGPVIQGLAPEAVKPVYEQIFALVEGGGVGWVHAAVARLLALLWATGGGGAASPPAGLGKVMTRMKHFYFEPLTVAGLAAEAGMSPTHFSRRFREVYGTSPIDWLRRERIRQAQRRLGDTQDPVQWIAEQVGYRDRFFFSKDFKRLTGLTPREFRRREAGNHRISENEER